MKRSGSGVWQGSFKDGVGAISTASGALENVPYSVVSRFEDRPGTNPEELLGAAHAGCFSMAFSLVLARSSGPHIDALELLEREHRFRIMREPYISGGPVEFLTQRVLPTLSQLVRNGLGLESP